MGPPRGSVRLSPHRRFAAIRENRRDGRQADHGRLRSGSARARAPGRPAVGRGCRRICRCPGFRRRAANARRPGADAAFASRGTLAAADATHALGAQAAGAFAAGFPAHSRAALEPDVRRRGIRASGPRRRLARSTHRGARPAHRARPGARHPRSASSRAGRAAAVADRDPPSRRRRAGPDAARVTGTAPAGQGRGERAGASAQADGASRHDAKRQGPFGPGERTRSRRRAHSRGARASPGAGRDRCRALRQRPADRACRSRLANVGDCSSAKRFESSERDLGVGGARRCGAGGAAAGGLSSGSGSRRGRAAGGRTPGGRSAGGGRAGGTAARGRSPGSGSRRSRASGGRTPGGSSPSGS